MQIKATASPLATYGIIGIPAFLLVWGILGMIKYVTGVTPGAALQNPAFPPGIQFLQWVLLIAFGVVFLLGYATRSPLTPFAVIVVSAMLATLCFVQTFDFLTNKSRYVAFALECVAYLAIGAFLIRSERMNQWFNRT